MKSTLEYLNDIIEFVRSRKTVSESDEELEGICEIESFIQGKIREIDESPSIFEMYLECVKKLKEEYIFKPMNNVGMDCLTNDLRIVCEEISKMIGVRVTQPEVSYNPVNNRIEFNEPYVELPFEKERMRLSEYCRKKGI